MTDTAKEDRKAMVKKKLAMRGLEQRKIYDSADASMNKSAMDQSKSRAAGGARDQNTMNRPSLQQKATMKGGANPRQRQPTQIGQKVAARGNQQAAETGSLGRKAPPPTAPVAQENGAPGAAKSKDADPPAAKSSETSADKSSKLMKFNLPSGVRSPLDMASLLSNMPEKSPTALDDKPRKHVVLPTPTGTEKEIEVNTNENENNDGTQLLDAASLLRHWNEMKSSQSKTETRSSLGMAVIGQSDTN